MCRALLNSDDSSQCKSQSEKRLLLASRGHPIRSVAYQRTKARLLHHIWEMSYWKEHRKTSVKRSLVLVFSKESVSIFLPICLLLRSKGACTYNVSTKGGGGAAGLLTIANKGEGGCQSHVKISMGFLCQESEIETNVSFCMKLIVRKPP